MENIVLKAPYLKYLKICTESDNQYISFFKVRVYSQMNHWIVDKHPSVENREMLYQHFLVFELMTLITFMGSFLYY